MTSPWSGLHYCKVPIKTTHCHSSDLSPQPKGPVAEACCESQCVSKPKTTEKLLRFVHHVVFVLIKVFDAAI